MANEFKIKNGLISDGDIVVTGSISATGGINIPGPIESAETASFAPSYTLTSSFNSYTSSASSSLGNLSGSVATTTSDLSSSIGSLSGSVATTTSGLAGRIGSVENKTGSYATTGSNVFVGEQVITGSICSNGNIVTTGQIVAQTINVQQVTSSIVYSCGSNTFGCSLTNNQVFTGSMLITGSNITANVNVVCFSGQLCSNTLSISNTSTFNGCVNVNTGNQVRLYNSAKNNWVQIESPLVNGDSSIDFKLTTQSGALYINNIGITCFNNTVCTPTLVVNKSNPILYINSGNNETSTIGFTQGAVSGYGGFIKVTTGLGDRAMTFGLSAAGTNNDATELIRLDDSGVTCFKNAICSPIAELTSDASCVPLRLINGVITGGSTAGVTGLYFGDTGSGVNMMQREKYAANQANLVLYSEYGYNTRSINGCFGYNGVAFYTAGLRRQNIDVDGVTCFASTVCAPNHIASSTCSTASLRVYGASGTHQWDLYLNGNNLRFSDNTSCAGCFVVDNTATFGGYVGVGTSPLTKLHLYDSSPNYILLTNTGADGVSNAIQGGIIGQSRGYSNNLAQMANILFRNKNTAAWYKGEISFSTNDSDGTNPAVSAVERMRIFSDGITCLSNTFCTPQLYLQQDSNSEVQFLSANNQNCTGTSSAARIDIGTWINQYALTLGRNGICTTGTRFGDNQANTTFIFDNAVSSCGMYIGLATSTGNLNLITASTKRMVISNTGISTFSCQICLKEALYVCGTFPRLILDRSATSAQSDIKFVDAGTSVWSIGTAVQAVGSNLDFYNYSLGGNVLKFTTTGEACFKYAVCTPVLRASRVISNSTQIFDSDFSLNAGVTRSVVLCGGIYTLGDFHLMVYGNAGTGMSTIRLSTAGYFANSNLLQFCELQRYVFGSMTISGVSNNGTSISFNIGNCSGGSNGTGFWRMISLNGDAENNCIRVFVL